MRHPPSPSPPEPEPEPNSLSRNSNSNSLSPLPLPLPLKLPGVKEYLEQRPDCTGVGTRPMLVPKTILSGI